MEKLPERLMEPRDIQTVRGGYPWKLRERQPPGTDTPIISVKRKKYLPKERKEL